MDREVGGIGGQSIRTQAVGPDESREGVRIVLLTAIGL